MSEGLGASLDLKETLERVARLTVPTSADLCMVYLREGDQLRVAAVAASDSALEAHLSQQARRHALPIDGVAPAARALRTGQAEWRSAVTNEWLEQVVPNPERRQLFSALLPGSFLLAPLVVRGRTLGVLALARRGTARPFAEIDVPWAEELAQRAAVAVENARLYTEAQQARDRQRILAEAGEKLATSPDLDATLTQVARLAIPYVADWCGVYLLTPRGDIEQVAVAHTDPRKEALVWELHRRLPIDPNGTVGVPAVIRSGRTEVRGEDALDWLEHAPLPEEIKAAMRALGLRAVITVPLVASGGVFGALTFGMAESGRHPDDDTVLMAQALASRAASAIDRARLLQEAIAANRKLRLLAEVSDAFVDAGFDLRGLAQSIAERVARSLGDSCSVYFLDPAGDQPDLAAVSHPDPAVADELWHVLQAHPIRAGRGLMGRVISENRTLRVDRVDVLALRAEILPQYWDFLERHPLTSYLSTPIAVGSQVVGVLGVSRYRRGGETPPPYTAEDELLLQDIAHRAALSVMRAREHEALRIEQQRLDAVLQQMPSAVTIVEAPSGRTLLRNAQNEAIFRQTAPMLQRIEQYSHFRGLHPDGRPVQAHEWPLSRSITHGEVVQGEEVRIIRGDGTHGYIRITSAPVRNERGDIVAGVVTFDDVTEQRRVSERIALLARVGEVLTSSLEWERTLAHVVDVVLPALGDFGFFDVIEQEDASTGEPVVRRIARAPGDEVRQAILDQTRWVRSDRQDMNLCALSTGAAALHAEIDEAWLRAVATSPEHLEMMRALGFVSMMTVPLRYESRLLGALTVFATDRARGYAPDDLDFAQQVAHRAASAVQNAHLYRDLAAKEKAVSQALAQARDAERRKDEFLAMLGHELRNPMSPILTALELMRTRDPEVHRYERSIIERQSRHLVRLVDDLLDVSRIARGKTELSRENVALADVVARATEMVMPLVEARRHRLEVEVPLALAVHGDVHRLAQVFANLLINAANYTDPGGLLEVRAVAQGAEVTVVVSDTGMGIAPELLSSIFDLFVQGERSLDRGAGGLGLGLTIVRNLVEQHGGSIRAESEGPGRGSRFLVTLPMAPAPAVAPEGTAPRDPGCGSAPAGRRVLVVDDNRDAAQTLAEVLVQMGFSVRVAFDPLEALDIAQPFAPEIAILDIGLPVMDGYELGRRLRGEGASPLLIALTGYGQRDDRERSAAAGFAVHLVKPVDLHRLRAVMREVTRS